MSEEPCHAFISPNQVVVCETHRCGLMTCLDRLKAENERLRADLSLAATLCFHGDKSSVVEVLKQYHNCQSSTSAGKEPPGASGIPGTTAPTPGPEPDSASTPKAEAGDTYCICGHSHKWHTSVGKVCWVPKCHCSMFKPASDDTEALDTPRCVHGSNERHWFSRYPSDSYYGGWCPGPERKVEGGT